MDLAQYLTLIAVLSPVLVVAYAIRVYERRRVLRDPVAIAAGIDAVHQEQFAAANFPADQPVALDFLFSSSTAASLVPLRAILEGKGFSVSTEESSGSTPAILVAKRHYLPSEVSFPDLRQAFVALCSSHSVQYGGPGPLSLTVLGVVSGGLHAA